MDIFSFAYIVINLSDDVYVLKNTVWEEAGIKRTLEQTPPELSSDIYDFGMMLTGGGAMLPGLARLLYEKTGLQVQIAKRPMESVCRGILRVINHPEGPEAFLRYRER